MVVRYYQISFGAHTEDAKYLLHKRFFINCFKLGTPLRIINFG